MCSEKAMFSLSYFIIFSISYLYLYIKHQKHIFLQNVLCLRNLQLKKRKRKEPQWNEHNNIRRRLAWEGLKDICIFFCVKWLKDKSTFGGDGSLFIFMLQSCCPMKAWEEVRHFTIRVFPILVLDLAKLDELDQFIELHMDSGIDYPWIGEMFFSTIHISVR